MKNSEKIGIVKVAIMVMAANDAAAQLEKLAEIDDVPDVPSLSQRVAAEAGKYGINESNPKSIEDSYQRTSGKVARDAHYYRRLAESGKDFLIKMSIVDGFDLDKIVDWQDQINAGTLKYEESVRIVPE